MTTGKMEPYSDGYRLTIKAEGNGKRVEIQRWAATKAELLALQAEAFEFVARALEGES